MSKETIGYCQGCGRLDHHLIEEMCERCRILFGLPEKPAGQKNGRPVRRDVALDHRSFRERLFFVVNQRQRVH